jgi:aminopeptidase N
MKGKLLLSILLLAATNTYSQEEPKSCASFKQHRVRSLARTAVASPAEDLYDVKYVKLDLAMNNTSTTLSGNVLTSAVTVQAMTQYVFELNPQLTIDSIKFNGALFTVSSSGIVRTVSLGASSLPAGQSFTTQVWYHGSPTSGTGFYTSGITTSQSPTWGTWVTFTTSEPYDSKDWWPCKQSLQDKIDSSDVWVTVSDPLRAGSNGKLVATTVLPGNKKRYEWSSRNSTDYYLISVAVAPYVDYSYYAHFSGSSDSVLIQNYVYDHPLLLPTFKSNIDSVGIEIEYFSQLFGRYPFWKEKYGHCMAPVNGGMENQTMTTLGGFAAPFFNTVVPHELAHQWFGDNVTCATWKDIWLNEGFASYATYLFIEHFYDTAAAAAWLYDTHYNAMTGVTMSDAGSVYVDDTTSDIRIFDFRLTYNKGGSVVHLLRYLAPSDSAFFAALRAYQQQYARRTATTDSFKNTIQPFYTRNLDTFFDEWVYGHGFPVYDAVWNFGNGQAFVRLTQQGTWPAVTPLFHLPVQVKFSGPQGDTTVSVEMSQASGFIAVPWSKPVSTVTVDPKDYIPHLINFIKRDPTLSIDQEHHPYITIWPNPSHTTWQIAGISEGEWRLTSLTGAVLSRGMIQVTPEISTSGLAPGHYVLQILDNNGITSTIKLIRD